MSYAVVLPMLKPNPAAFSVDGDHPAILSPEVEGSKPSMMGQFGAVLGAFHDHAQRGCFSIPVSLSSCAR